MIVQCDGSWHARCNPGLRPCVSESPIVRRMNMRLFATVLALTLTAGTAAASPLDFQPGPINPGAAQVQDFNANRTLLERSGPIRRRWGGRERYENYRSSEPMYWASLGAGTFD